MYKLFLTLRYLRKRRIVYIAIAAVTLCVAMVLVVLSVMGGWLDMVKDRARGLLGDIVLDNSSYSGMPLYEELLREIASHDEPWKRQIEQATPVIYGYGLIRFPGTGHNDTVRVVGIRLDEIVRVNAFRSGLFYERYYPGTTHLGEQRRPVFGRDLSAPLRRSKDGRGMITPFVLPEPFQSALEQARADALRRTGRPLVDEETWEEPGGLNQVLAAEGLDPIPGLWSIDASPEWGMETAQWVDEPAPGLIIGRDIVADRKSDGRYRRFYPKGTLVYVTLWAASITGNVDPIPISQPFRYVDDSRTGIYDIDSRHVYCDFDLLQQRLQMGAADRVDPDDPTRVLGRAPARCSQIQVKLSPGANAAELCARLEALVRRIADRFRDELDPVEIGLVEKITAKTWQQTQAHIIVPVEKEKVLVTILFGIISLVAVVLILCILYMIVLQKTRDIGILKAIGASSGGAAAIWVLYGLCVGVVGGAIGTTLGSLFVIYINDIQEWLIRINPSFRVWDLKVYSFDQIPHHVNPRDVAVVATLAVLASTIGSVAAAWRAGRMEPVESIRYE